jgi:hypothetical protein
MPLHKFAFLAILFLSFTGCASKPPAYFNGPALLRIRNDTGKNLTDVKFQRNLFVHVPAGTTAPYQPLATWPQNPSPEDFRISVLFEGAAQRTPYLFVDTGGPFVNIPGNWTFVLTLNPDVGAPTSHLDIKTEEDETPTPEQVGPITTAIADALADLKRARIHPDPKLAIAKLRGVAAPQNGRLWELPVSTERILEFGRAALPVVNSSLQQESELVRNAFADVVSTDYVLRSPPREKNGVQVRLYYAMKMFDYDYSKRPAVAYR